MIDCCLLMITHVVEDDTQVDMSEELSCYVCNLLMLVMKFYSIFVVLWIVGLSQFHVVHSNTVVREGLTMDISDCFAHLEELLVLINSLLILAKVVKQDSS